MTVRKRHCHFRSEAYGIPVTAKNAVTDSIVSLVLSRMLLAGEVLRRGESMP